MKYDVYIKSNDGDKLVTWYTTEQLADLKVKAMKEKYPWNDYYYVKSTMNRKGDSLL